MNRIGHKIIAVVATVVTVCLLLLGSFYIQNQESSILAQNERTMAKLTQSVTEALQSIMVAGHAEVARSYADRLEAMADVIDFRIMRVDGQQAFLDNDTINDVNRRRGAELFAPRPTEEQSAGYDPGRPEFKRVLADRVIVPHYETSPSGERILTFLAPIENTAACHVCHGADARLRGVLMLMTSLAMVQEDIDRTWQQSMLVIIGVILAIVLITGLVINRMVVSPIDTVTDAMHRATRGDLQIQVPVLGRDELSRMASSFNMMTEELERTYDGLRSEQDKLATIILSAQEGIVVTDSRGNVVLVNPAAEKLLGKNAGEIIQSGFLNILDDQRGLQLLLERDTDIKEPEIVEFNNLVLSVYADTIKNPKGDHVGSAALIRDITEEKRLEEGLRRLSTTDGLTGLFNRRHLDESLTGEYRRSMRYKTPLSIFMFDVDHFKKFNDVFGHDQGDRVLKMIAAVLRQNMRNIDLPCRYGGEEFMAIMPGTGLEGAKVVAERTREQIEVTEVDGLNVTVSIGVATLSELESENPEAFVEAADRALYEAKSQGRNCVVVATSDPDKADLETT